MAVSYHLVLILSKVFTASKEPLASLPHATTASDGCFAHKEYPTSCCILYVIYLVKADRSFPLPETPILPFLAAGNVIPPEDPL